MGVLFFLIATAALTVGQSIYPAHDDTKPCYKNASLHLLPFCNPKLTAEQRAADLVSRLTVEEKIKQVGCSAALGKTLTTPFGSLATVATTQCLASGSPCTSITVKGCMGSAIRVRT